MSSGPSAAIEYGAVSSTERLKVHSIDKNVEFRDLKKSKPTDIDIIYLNDQNL